MMITYDHAIVMWFCSIECCSHAGCLQYKEACKPIHLNIWSWTTFSNEQTVYCNFSTFDFKTLLGWIFTQPPAYTKVENLLQEAALKADFHALLELVGAKVLVLLMGRGGLRATDSTRGSLNGKPSQNLLVKDDVFQVVVSTKFYAHPYLGKDSNLTNIFQMGWNHQVVLVECSIYINTVSWFKFPWFPLNFGFCFGTCRREGFGCELL